MGERPEGPLDLGKYLAMAQVGFEMVVPIGIGLLLDRYLGWAPWGVVGGVVLGLGGGLYHLIVLANRMNKNDTSSGRKNGS